jgi:hypothetical protein
MNDLTMTRAELEAELRTAKERVAWLERKIDGEKVAGILELVPAGFEFDLGHDAGRAYRALYRKNADGSWDQVPGTCESPHVVNMDAAHLGFVVGYQPIANAVNEALTA